jgi:hypothetical protein
MQKTLPFLSSVLLVLCSCSNTPPADQVVMGRIWTGNEQQPWAEAMAIVGDSIVAVGGNTVFQKKQL